MENLDDFSTFQKIYEIVKKIRRADYEGNRTALREYFEDLDYFTKDEAYASKVLYWRGFAMWRIAVNGFNDSAGPKELELALKTAIKEFDLAASQGFVNPEAKIGAGACQGLLAYLHRDKMPMVKVLVRSARELLHEVEMLAADNPRLLWALGPICWNTPAERGGGPEKAIDLYKKGLDNLKVEANPVISLEPTWGEPELLMSLAWSYLNLSSSDPYKAERYALAALRIVPYWHYTRDILLPQIMKAKKENG